jgi:methionine-rich copper-binding protein CopC
MIRLSFPMRTRRLGLSLGVAACTVAIITPSETVHAAVRRHLKLVRSFPAADTTLAASPDAIRLWLSEPTELPATKIAVTTQGGAAVATSAITRAEGKDAPVVASMVKPVSAGRYTVTWKAMSKDGHVVNGTFNFMVGAAR